MNAQAEAFALALQGKSAEQIKSDVEKALLTRLKERGG
jgi:hypothetical protein